MNVENLANQIGILSAQFDEFKFWLVAGLALLGVVAAVIVATSSAYIKSHVKDGIIEGAKEAQKALDRTLELDRQVFLMSQRIKDLEKIVSKTQWRDLPLTAPINAPATGFGRYAKTQDGIVMVYIDTYCDSPAHPIATLPDGFRPRRDIEIAIYAVDVMGKSGHPVPIRGIIDNQGRIYAKITSDGMQCPINTLFISSDQT